MKARVTVITLLVIILIPVAYSYYSYSMIKVSNRYAEKFYEDLIELVNQNETFDMTDVTDFEWDTMHIFYPYTSREEMEKRIGQEWTTSSYIGYYLLQKSSFGDHPLLDDSLTKIVFVNGDRIVLDITVNRGEVDLTQVKQVVYREEAQFTVQGNILLQTEERLSLGKS